MKVIQVKVAFDSGVKEYNYLCLESLEVKVGDRVVVEARDTSAVVTVTRVMPYEGSKISLRWVLAKETDLIGAMLETKRKWGQVQVLRAKLEERRRKFEEQDVWRVLAENDSEAAELFKQLKELEN